MKTILPFFPFKYAAAPSHYWVCNPMLRSSQSQLHLQKLQSRCNAWYFYFCDVWPSSRLSVYWLASLYKASRRRPAHPEYVCMCWRGSHTQMGSDCKYKRTRNTPLLTGKMKKTRHVRFEVLTTVVMKSTIFWDITPCSLLSVNRRFGRTYRLYLQGRKNQLSKKPAWKQVASFHAGFLFILFLRR
jgi:hypothetical protein